MKTQWNITEQQQTKKKEQSDVENLFQHKMHQFLFVLGAASLLIGGLAYFSGESTDYTGDVTANDPLKGLFLGASNEDDATEKEGGAGARSGTETDDDVELDDTEDIDEEQEEGKSGDDPLKTFLTTDSEEDTTTGTETDKEDMTNENEGEGENADKDTDESEEENENTEEGQDNEEETEQEENIGEIGAREDKEESARENTEAETEIETEEEEAGDTETEEEDLPVREQRSNIFITEPNEDTEDDSTARTVDIVDSREETQETVDKDLQKEEKDEVITTKENNAATEKKNIETKEELHGSAPTLNTRPQLNTSLPRRNPHTGGSAEPLYFTPEKTEKETKIEEQVQTETKETASLEEQETASQEKEDQEAASNATEEEPKELHAAPAENPQTGAELILPLFGLTLLLSSVAMLQRKRVNA